MGSEMCIRDRNIESLGHTCEFINIIPGEQLEGYKTSCFYNIKLLFQRLWGWDFYKRFQTIFVFQNRFRKEFLPYLGVKKGINTKHYDVVVIGSDEVLIVLKRLGLVFRLNYLGKD